MSYYIAMGMAFIAELMSVGLIIWLIRGKKAFKHYTVIEVKEIVDEDEEELIYI